MEYIVSADIERILHEALERGSNTAEVGSRVEALRRSGILDLQQVSLERKEEGGRSQDRLELSFDNPRRGLASWLAPPAPMGTLEFISPEAELDLTPTRDSLFDVGYRYVSAQGTTPFIWDQRDIRHELRLQYQVSGPWAFGVRTDCGPLPADR